MYRIQTVGEIEAECFEREADGLDSSLRLYTWKSRPGIVARIFDWFGSGKGPLRGSIDSPHFLAAGIGQIQASVQYGVLEMRHFIE